MLSLVLDLLLIDESNPRSVAFQLEDARQSSCFPSRTPAAGGSRSSAWRSRCWARFASSTSPRSPGRAQGVRANLRKLLDRQVTVLPDLSDAIGRRYFDLLEKGARWVRARSAKSHDLRRQPSHHLHLPQASAAVPAPHPPDAALGPRQTVLRHNLLIEPAPAANLELEDYFGNSSAILKIDDEH